LEKNMASGTTELDVVNRALIKIGAKEISSLTESGRNPRIMNAMIDVARDKFLRTNPWNYGVTRAQIAKDTVAPEWGWSSRFVLPSDYIKMLAVESSTNTEPTAYQSKNTPKNIEYKIEGDYILCDETDPINIRYVKRETDMSRWDSMATEALASLLAYEACIAVSGDKQMKQMFYSEYKDCLDEARHMDGWDDDMYDYPEDDWVLATL
jgi:hypothetical protein